VRPRVYVETSVVSYLTALPSRDLVRAAHQQVTVEWWATREGFDLYISQVVLTEVAKGDAAAATRRLAATEGLEILSATPDAQRLATALLEAAALPSKAAIDAAHVCHCGGPRHECLADLELRSYRERADAPAHRTGLPEQRRGTADHLHPGRATPEKGGRVTRDPIVEEVRAVRDEIAKEFNYDIPAIFEALRALERESGRPTVSLPPRRPDASTRENAAQPAVATDE